MEKPILQFWSNQRLIWKGERKDAVKLIKAGVFDNLNVMVWTQDLENFNLHSQRGAQYFGIKELNRR